MAARQQTLALASTSQCEPPGPSPNGGSTEARRALHDRFADRLAINPTLTRRIVSYQDNKAAPGLRWLKYKEAFSRALVEQCIDEVEPTAVLDPFAGVGTVPLIAAARGLDATGIEISPVGVLTGKTISHAANGLDRTEFEAAADTLLREIGTNSRVDIRHSFRHVPITQSAFSPETEAALSRARRAISRESHAPLRAMLDMACLSVLEEVSYTRKDGQYLRWDERSGRTLRARLNKGPIPTLSEALTHRLSEMAHDIEPLKRAYGGGTPTLFTGSCLELLHETPDNIYDMVMTSPPYANRYDYTRTYALELAWLGFDQDQFLALRQRMLSATVENKSKRDELRDRYGADSLLDDAIGMYEGQAALHEVLTILRRNARELSNPHVIRLLEGYFFELSLVVAELGRIVRSGGTVVMVNDNVRYHGEEVPVDLILSDFAEQAGFRCTRIDALPRGKGNASQQMGRFGRREIRKCVYWWTREDG